MNESKRKSYNNYNNRNSKSEVYSEELRTGLAALRQLRDKIGSKQKLKKSKKIIKVGSGLVFDRYCFSCYYYCYF